MAHIKEKEEVNSEIFGQTNSILNDEIQISPFVRSMATVVHLPNEIDYKKEYKEYLLEKYQ